MVDRGGCDGIEKFVDGSTLVCVRVVYRAVHGSQKGQKLWARIEAIRRKR